MAKGAEQNSGPLARLSTTTTLSPWMAGVVGGGAAAGVLAGPSLVSLTDKGAIAAQQL